MLWVLVAALVWAPPAVAQTAPIDTLVDLRAALVSCWEPPPGSDGSELTVRFSLRRDGSLLGRPMITYSRLTGDAAADRAFVASVLGALQACLPVAITDRLGGAVAGRPMTLFFSSERTSGA